MIDPLSLALPLAVHQQLFGDYVDVARLERPVQVNLTVEHGASGVVLTSRQIEGSVRCVGAAPGATWGTLVCTAPPPLDACGETFEVDARFVAGVLQTRGRSACVVEAGTWPAAAAYVKVNPLALALAQNRGPHGGSETAAVLGGALTAALGPDPDVALRRFGVGAVAALGALGVSPYAVGTTVALTPETMDRIGGAGVLGGATACAGTDAEACFRAQAERFGAGAVYDALARDRSLVAEVCPVAQPALPAPKVDGALHEWDFDGDGQVDYQEDVDGAGRIVAARARVPSSATLVPTLTRVYGADGRLRSELRETYEFGHSRVRLAFRHDRQGRVTRVDRTTDAGTRRVSGAWDADGWLRQLVVTEDGKATRSRPATVRLAEEVPASLIAEGADAGPSLLTVERDADGRLVRIGAPGVGETTWSYDCAGAACRPQTVTRACTAPGSRCRPQTWTCAAP